MRFDRLILFILILVLPVAFWPGSTSYDSLKFTLLALAAACWLGGLAWRLGTGRTLRRPPTGLSAAGISLLIVLSVSAVKAHNADLVWRTVGLTALWLLVAVQTAMAADAASRLRGLLAAGVLSGTVVCLYGLIQMAGWVPGAPVESGFPPGISTLGNQNYVAGLAAALLWPSVVLWFGAPRTRLIPGMAATSILAATVIFAGAAGPMMAAAGAALLIGPPLVMVRLGAARRAPLVFAFMLVLSVGGGAILMADAVRPDHSSDNTTPALHRRLFRENHGDVRRTDWLVARELFLSSPLTGKGAGNYAALWPVTRAKLEADPAVYGLADHEPVAARAHNEIFQFLGETGSVGGIWLAGGLVLAVLSWLRRWRSLPDDPARHAFLLLTAGALTVGLHAMVSFPVHLPATALALALIIGLTASPVFAHPMIPPDHWKGSRLLAVVPGALALLLAGGAVQEFVGDLHTATGRRYFAAGRINLASKHLEEGYARRKWPAENSLYLGLTGLATGNADEARYMLEMSLAGKPTFEGYLALAELAIDQGRFGEADTLLGVVEGCRPFMTFRYQAAYLRGLSHLRQGNHDEARPRFRALIKEDPRNQRAWLALGYLEVLGGNPGQARVYYSRALTIIQDKIREARQREGGNAAGEIVRLNRHLKTAENALKSVDRE